MSGESLFGSGGEAERSGSAAPSEQAKVDAVLIEAYKAGGRTLDDLPYTREFEVIFNSCQIVLQGSGLSQREVFHRLHNLRKAGRLPRAGRAASVPPKIQEDEEAALVAMVVAAVGTLGQRDQLPYTPQFDEIVERFNAQTGRSLDPHTVWRLVAKAAK